MRRVLVGILSCVLWSAALGCSSIPKIPQLPPVVEAADRHIEAVTGNLVQLLTLTAESVEVLSRIEHEASQRGAVPVQVDAKFDQLILEYAELSEKAVNGLTQGSLKTWPELRTLVEPVLAKGQEILDFAQNIGAIKDGAKALLIKIRDQLSAAAGEFLFGGHR